METKTAFITGVTGQDGYYLSRFLLEKGYDVHGFARKVARNSDKEFPVTGMHYGDITDANAVEEAIKRAKPDEVYHLASQSDVAYSFKHPDETYHTNIDGTLNVLNAVRKTGAKMYFAGTSEMFGKPDIAPQNEEYPMSANSPYAVSKIAGYQTCRIYRKAYNMYISSGILYNHESPRRGSNFVTRKITLGVAEYVSLCTSFELGNLDARKDWGYAGDYVKGMWMMLQQEHPDDYILATNEQHSVYDFLMLALHIAGISAEMIIDSEGNKKIIDTDEVRAIATVNKNLYRPIEADNYMGDYSKARDKLGWKPEVGFYRLVEMMMKHDLGTGEQE